MEMCILNKAGSHVWTKQPAVPRAGCAANKLPLLALLVIGIPSGRANCQGPAPLPANPQAPTLNMPVPVGAKRGGSLEITLTGSNLAEPTGLWTSFPAAIAFPTDNNNGKDNSKLRVRLRIARDAPLGFHAIRLATTRGLSNLRLFCIDDLPQIMRVDTNRAITTPQAVTPPCVVVGRADAEAADYYKVIVHAGQRLTFEVIGRRLGSAFDPQITLYDARTARELEGGHNNDSPGLQTDPRLTYTFKRAGDYLVEVRDTLYRGGADFWYRLRIGDFPCATTPLPMAARRGSQVEVRFAGPLAEETLPVEVSVPADPTLETISIVPKGPNGLYGWPVALALTDHEELLEQEPNDDPAHATRVGVPVGITGRFQTSGDIDYYVFSATRGTRYVVEAQTIEWSSPAEVYLTLKDQKGNQLVASNPQAPPRIDFQAPADGDYFVAVEHLLNWGGPSETYHLTIKTAEPDFELAVGGDRFDVHPGGSAAIPLWVTRKGYAGPIEVRVNSTPGISGQVTIASNQPTAAKQPAATLLLSASPGMPQGPYSFALEASAIINGRVVVRKADVHSAVSRELGGLRFPPRNLLAQMGLAVLTVPFELAVEPAQLKVPQGGKAKLKVTANRKSYAGPINLAVRNLPASVTALKATIAAGQTSTQIEVSAAANAQTGEKADLNVLGTTGGGNVPQQASPNFRITIMKR